MFYEVLLSLCNDKGEKPTPLLKELHLSPGNLKNWKNGASVNSDVLQKLAEHFNVSVDYLLNGKNICKKTPSINLSEDEAKAIDYFNRLTSLDKDYIIGEMARLIKSYSATEEGNENQHRAVR